MYDPFFISTYNVCFTSLPIVVVGIFDKDVDAVASVRFGRLFTPGIRDAFFNRKLFAFDAVWGLVGSLVVAGFPAGTDLIFRTSSVIHQQIFPLITLGLWHYF